MSQIQNGPKTCRLARCAGEQYVPTLFQIRPYLGENVSRVALDVFAAFEFIPFFPGRCPLVHHTEMIGITCSVYGPSLGQYPIRQCDKNGPAPAGRHLLSSFVPNGIHLRECCGIPPGGVRTEGTCLFAQPASDAAVGIHLGIKKPQSVRVHRNGTSRTNVHACRASAALGLIFDSDHVGNTCATALRLSISGTVALAGYSPYNRSPATSRPRPQSKRRGNAASRRACAHAAKPE